MTRLNLLSLCVLLLLAVVSSTQTAASSPTRIRGQHQLARQLEDQQAEDGDAQQDEQQDQQEEEEQEEEEDQGDYYDGEYADDVFVDDDEGENKAGQMFETAPENWTAEQWSFMVLLFIAWGALTSCICATGWMCSCLGCTGGGGAAAKAQPFGYDPSASSKQGDDSPPGCCPSTQDYVAMTGTEANKAYAP